MRTPRQPRRSPLTADTGAGSGATRWNYVIFDYLVDPERGRTVPVGVALAGPGTGRVMLRFPEPAEKVRGITGQRPRTLVGSTREQLMGWVSTGEVPYGDPGMAPGSSPWWAVVRDLLSFSVRARPPLAIDCTAPEDDLESLYRTIVDPIMVCPECGPARTDA